MEKGLGNTLPQKGLKTMNENIIDKIKDQLKNFSELEKEGNCESKPLMAAIAKNIEALVEEGIENRTAENLRQKALKKADDFLCTLNLNKLWKPSFHIIKYDEEFSLSISGDFCKQGKETLEMLICLDWRVCYVFDKNTNRWIKTEKVSHTIIIDFNDKKHTFSGAELAGLKFYKSPTFPDISGTLETFADAIKMFAKEKTVQVEKLNSSENPNS